MNKIQQPMEVQQTNFRSFATSIVAPVIKIIANTNVSGLENLPPKGAVVLACNHVTMLDAFILQLSLPRPIFFMSKVENFRNPLIKFLMHQLGSFPVERGASDRAALQHAFKVLKAGEVLGMFPEGTRTHGNGLVEAKTGTAHLAMRANAPILPVAIYGTENILHSAFRKAKVNLKILPVIYSGKEEKASELTFRLMRAIASELPRSLQGYYAYDK
jgi:1-acyl-sn-glycerol-3-phosphate acyltransferase